MGEYVPSSELSTNMGNTGSQVKPESVLDATSSPSRTSSKGSKNSRSSLYRSRSAMSVAESVTESVAGSITCGFVRLRNLFRSRSEPEPVKVVPLQKSLSVPIRTFLTL